MLAISTLDQICSRFASQQWNECLDLCKSFEISGLDSDQIALFFMLYLRTILSLKSSLNSMVWDLVLSHYKTISQIPIQICIVEIHVLLALNSPHEASNLCRALYSCSHANEILEIHLFSVILPNSLMSKSEILTFLDEKSKSLQIDIEKHKAKISSTELVEPLVSNSPLQKVVKYLAKLDRAIGLGIFGNGTIVIIIIFILYRYIRHKYKTF